MSLLLFSASFLRLAAICRYGYDYQHAQAWACTVLIVEKLNQSLSLEEYASLPDVDGFVVGRAGLDCTKLSSICNTLKASAKEL